MSQKERRVQPESQASPLSDDVIRQLQGFIDGDGFSAPTALQREAGTAIRQFINSGAPQLPAQVEASLQETQERQREEALADLREQFGAEGRGRFGTSLGRATSDLLNRMSAQQVQDRFTLRQDLGSQQLRAATLASRMGARQLDPFIRIAQQGIVPEEVAFEPHPVVQGAQALGGLARGAGSLIGAL